MGDEANKNGGNGAFNCLKDKNRLNVDRMWFIP